MLKCPACGSSRYRKFVEGRKLKRKCEKCGFANIRELVEINDKWMLS